MSTKFQTALLIGIAFVVVMLYMRRPEKQIPIVQDIEVIQPENRSITVIGQGEVKTNLDKAEFIIAFHTDEEELADAKMKGEKIYKEAINILSIHGVEEKDIVDGYTRVLVRMASSTTADKKIYGYIVYRTIKVTVNYLDELNALFMDLQAADVYEINQITISVSNIDGFRERALQLAVEDAGKRANAIGRENNLEIGRPISIQTYNPYYSESSYTYYYETLDLFLGRTTNSRENVLNILEVSITAQVTVVYELK